jgi:hypothetical protein
MAGSDGASIDAHAPRRRYLAHARNGLASKPVCCASAASTFYACNRREAAAGIRA